MRKAKNQPLLDSLIYLEIPDELLKSISFSLHSSIVDSGVKLPVQIADSTNGDFPDKKRDFDISTLTVEMILAGMLIVFAYEREHKDIEYYRHLFLQLRPNIREEMLSGILIKINNRDYELAESLLESLIGLDEKCVNAYLMLAYLYEQKAKEGKKEDKKYRVEAKKIYDELICTEPPLPAVFFNAAIFFMEEGEYTRAKDLLETYIALKIDDEDEQEVKKVEKAQNSLNYINNRVVQDSNFKKAISLIDQGKASDALPLIQHFIEENPKNWNGWFLLGWALRVLKRWQEGEVTLQKSFELYQKNENKEFEEIGIYSQNECSQICNELAICLMENGKLNEAQSVLEISLSKDCENVKLISNLGVVAMKKGDDAKAVSYFRTALYIDPDDPIATFMLKKYGYV